VSAALKISEPIIATIINNTSQAFARVNALNALSSHGLGELRTMFF
jgi:hypothetical protein